MLIASLLIGSPEGGANPAGTLFMLLAFVGIFYFLLVRPQQRQRKAQEQMVRGLKKGDEVLTVGGIVGKIVHIQDDILTIKTGDTRIEVERTKIGQVLSQG